MAPGEAALAVSPTQPPHCNIAAPIDHGTVLLCPEMIGVVRGVDGTGRHFDDTRRSIEAADLSAADRERIVERNARRVYPRLDAALGSG